MAIIIDVDLGTPNAGNGDPLRVGGQTINDNFDSLNLDKLETGGYVGTANDLFNLIGGLGDPLQRANNLSDLIDPAAARTNIGFDEFFTLTLGVITQSERSMLMKDDNGFIFGNDIDFTWVYDSVNNYFELQSQLGNQWQIQSNGSLEILNGDLTIPNGGALTEYFANGGVATQANADDIFTDRTMPNNSFVQLSNGGGSSNFPNEFGHVVAYKGANAPRDFALWKSANNNEGRLELGYKNGSAWQWTQIITEANASTELTQFLRSDAASTKTAGALKFNDNIFLEFGNAIDARMYHNGTNTLLDLFSGTTDFLIRDNSTIRFTFSRAGDFTLATGSLIVGETYIRDTYPQIRLQQTGNVPYADFGTGSGFSVFNAFDHTTNVIQFRNNSTPTHTLGLNGDFTLTGDLFVGNTQIRDNTTGATVISQNFGSAQQIIFRPQGDLSNDGQVTFKGDQTFEFDGTGTFGDGSTARRALSLQSTTGSRGILLRDSANTSVFSIDWNAINYLIQRSSDDANLLTLTESNGALTLPLGGGLTTGTSGSIDGLVSVLGSNSANDVWSWEDNYSRHRIGGVPTNSLGWRWDNFDSVIMTLAKTGDLTLNAGGLTANGIIEADTFFKSSDSTVVLSTDSAGTVFLRPNGQNDTTGQFILTVGGATVNGDLTASEGCSFENALIVSNPAQLGSNITTLNLAGGSGDNTRSGGVRVSSNNGTLAGAMYFLSSKMRVGTVTAQNVEFTYGNAVKAAVTTYGFDLGLTTATQNVIRHTPTTFANLPTGVDGMRAIITDATSATFNALVNGGGSNKVPVWYDATAVRWKVG